MNYTKILLFAILLIASYLIYKDFTSFQEPKKIIKIEKRIDTINIYKETIKTVLKTKLDSLYIVKNDTTIILNNCNDSINHYQDLMSRYEFSLNDAMDVINTQDTIITLKDSVITELKKQPKNKLKVWQVGGLILVGALGGKLIKK